MDAQRKGARVGRLRPAALLPAIAPIAAVGVAVTFFMTSGAGAAEETNLTASPTTQLQVANAPFERELPGRPRNVPSATASGPALSTPPRSATPPVQPPTPCLVSYRLVNSWGQGFQADVTLHNSATAALRDWRLTWRNPDGVRITNAWNGVIHVDGADVAVTSASWNATIEPGAAVTIGYTATTDNASEAPGGPAEFRLNGAACRLA